MTLFAWCERRYPGAYTLRLFHWGDIVWISHLPSVRRLLAAGADVRHANEPLQPLFGSSSPMVLDGEPHARLRRILLAQLRGDRLARYERLIAEATVLDLERWPMGRPFRLAPRMRAITADVVMSLVFGDATGGRRPRLRSLIVRFTLLGGHRAMLFPVLRVDLGRFSPWGHFLRLRRELDEIVFDEIQARRQRPAGGDDLLSALVGAVEDGVEPLTDIEIRDLVVSLLFAGYETSAMTLCWCFDLILRCPGLVERLRASMEAGDDAYVNAVVKEVLRLRTIIVAVGRRLTRQMSLGGHLLPAGTHVAANIAQVHHDPGLFPEPDAFLPERFLGAGQETSGWMPFGGGSHRCPGMSPALIGTRAVLRTVLSRARLRPAARRSERVALGGVTAAPRRGVRVVLEERP
jgi:cytochrome P450